MINISDEIKGFIDSAILKFNSHIQFKKNNGVSGVVSGNLSKKVDKWGITSAIIEKNSYSVGYLKRIYNGITVADQYKLLFPKLQDCIFHYFEKYLNSISYSDTVHTFEIESIWVVFQKEGDYASIHHHSPNKFAGIMYLEAPIGVTTETFPNGMMIILNAQNRMYTIQPAPSTLYFWPGHFLHLVYPFRGKGTKVAIAFNLKTKD